MISILLKSAASRILWFICHGYLDPAMNSKVQSLVQLYIFCQRKKMTGSLQYVIHKPWIIGLVHEFSGPVHGQTFPVSEEKMAGSLSSVVHNPWISWLGHEFSGPVYGPDLSCLRRKKMAVSLWSISHGSLETGPWIQWSSPQFTLPISEEKKGCRFAVY